MEAAVGSQLLEGDEYPTSSLVVPTVFRLMSYSSDKHDVYFRNRDEDEYNDAGSNPVTVPHADLQVKVREARALYHGRLITRFDTELPHSVKKFWFVSSMLDPRFKKLSFDGDSMLKPAMRRDAVKWLTQEYLATSRAKCTMRPPRPIRPLRTPLRTTTRTQPRRRATRSGAKCRRHPSSPRAASAPPTS